MKTPQQWAAEVAARINEGDPVYTAVGENDEALIAKTIEKAIEEALVEHHCESCDGSAPECRNKEQQHENHPV